GFDRCADLFALRVDGRIDEAAIFASPHLAPALLDGYAVERQQGAVFSERLKAVLAGYAFQHVSDLLLHVALRRIHAPQRFVLRLPLALGRMQAVLLLQSTGDVLAAAVQKAIADFLPLLVHA